MIAKANDFKRRVFFKGKKLSFFVLLCVLSFMGLTDLSSQTLNVYDTIPGRRTYEQSQNITSKYTCRVRRVGTTTWQKAFVMQTISKIANNNFVNPNGVKGNGYQDKLNNWTASWIAFEFSGMSVEVEISKVGGAAITKAKVRPVGDATDATIVNGKVYVTLDKNANINVDIDGQMEDNYTGMGYSGPPVHTISIFGNPVFKVPNISNPRVKTVNPGEAIPSSNTTAWDTIYFKPGVHNIGTPYEINSNKVIYIPGNAVLYGSIHPVNTWDPMPTNWSVYGSGTLSLEKENWVGDGVAYNKAFTYRATKVRLEGFVIADPANHTLNLYNPSTNTSEVNTYKNIKILGWRINGDAINTFNNSTVTDCFFRVQDDVFYYGENNVKISNCVAWNDYNGSVLYVTRGANTFDESYFKDIKVIYHRAGWHKWGGGRVISFRDRKPGDVIKNVQIKNVLVEDPYPAFGPFNLFFSSESTGSALVDFSNIVIENVRQDHVEVTVDGYRAKNSMLGLDNTRKFKNITFKNCSYNGKMLGSFADGEFITNPYVENIQFQTNSIPANYTITSSVGANGSINPSGNVSVISNTNQTFTITPNSGYQVDAVTVDGVSQGSITSYTFTNVTASHTISATFKTATSTISAFSQIEAENFSSKSSNINSEPCSEGGQNVGWIENGSYIAFNNVDFGSGAASFQARVACGSAGGSIEVRLGSPTGTLVGTCLVTNTGAWQSYTTMNCAINGASGIQNLYLVFKGGASYLFNLNWIKFITASLPDVAALTAWTSGTTFNKVNGNNRLLTVMVMGEHATADFNVAGVTYGGQAMTKVTDRVIGTGFRTYAALFTLNEWGVNAALTGTINVSWSSAPAGFEVYSVLLSNVDQTTPISSTANNALVGTTITTGTLAAASGDMLIMCGSTENNTTNNFNNGFTKQFESNTAWGDGVGGYKMGTGVSVTPSFTQSASGRMVLCAMVAKKSSSSMKAPAFTDDNEDVLNTLQTTIRLYPNPVSSMLNIDFVDTEISKEVKIFNTLGQLAYSLRTNNPNVQIDVKSLKLKGFVTVHVVVGNDISKYKVVVN